MIENDIRVMECGATSSELPNGALGLDQIPFYSECRVGAIFLEGEAEHGRDNWKKGANDPSFHRERLIHARTHLQLYLNGDRSEDHLAKVAWGMVAVMELQRLNSLGEVERIREISSQLNAAVQQRKKR